jgi:hypothetical protein
MRRRKTTEAIHAAVTTSTAEIYRKQAERHHARYTVVRFRETQYRVLDKVEGYRGGAFDTEANAESFIEILKAIDAYERIHQ